MAKVGTRIGWALVLLFAAGAGLAGIGLWWGRPLLFADPLGQAVEAYKRSEWREASRLASKQLTRAPKDRDALRLLARASARLGYDDEAQALYRRLGSERMKAEDYDLLAEGLLRQQKTDLAWGSLELARRDDPNHPETLHTLARLYARKDQLEEATPFARQLSTIPGWEARGGVILGLLLKEQHDPAGAADALKRALERDPTLQGAPSTPVAIRKLLARVLLEIHQPAEAKAQLELVLPAGPDPEAAWLMSRAALQARLPEAAGQIREQSNTYRSEHPIEPEPAPYIGSARCAECHQANYRTQQSSRHARTFHRAAALAKLPLPPGEINDPSDKNIVHTIKYEEPNLRVETRVEDKLLRALVAYAFGSDAKGVTLVGAGDDGQTRELRLSHYSDGSGWDRTTGHSPQPNSWDKYLGEPLSSQEVRLCFGCHTTNFRAAREQVGPEAADRGIGCERCHGPGGLHVLSVSAGMSDLAIAQPRLATAAQITSLCGQCHSPRAGQVGPSDPTSARFQANTLARSRCYTESGGALSCVTCHSPHRDAETSPAFYEDRCLVCHTAAPKQPLDARAGGTRPIKLSEGIKRVPCPVNPDRDCLKCHMPAVTGIAPHAVFSDHNIRIHRETVPPAE